MVAADAALREQDDVLATALLSLLRFRLSPREQNILRAVILAPTPPTAWQVAKRTHLAYSHAKATVRTLIAWGMLTRTPKGLCFQTEPAHWGPPAVPSPLANGTDLGTPNARAQDLGG